MLGFHPRAFQQDLAATAWQAAAGLPTRVDAALNRSIYHVAASGLLSQVLPVGGLAPDFTLPAADGRFLSLAHLLKRGSVVLTFYRGHWCAYCNVQLRAYQRQLVPELASLGATLVAVSPQVPAFTRLTAKEKGLGFPVLSDAGSRVARQYGLAYQADPALADALRCLGIDLRACNGPGNETLPLTATFVIAPDGRVSWRWAEASFKHRADPEQLLQAVALLAATPQA